MNTIFDTLRGMRLTGGIFLDAEFTAPWCVTAQVEPEDCSPFMPVPRHIIAYHYVTTGHCLLTVNGQPATLLEGGEIVILPRNDPHLLANALNVAPVRIEHLIRRGVDGGVARVTNGGGGERTHILCGFLGTDTPSSSTIAMLPDVLKLSTADWAAASWIESSFRFAAQESAKGQADSGGGIAKLAELLLFEAVRRYLILRPHQQKALMAGMHDALIGRALGLLHKQLSRHWTTESLAYEVGLSRSSFAERFTRAVGEPPMRYLACQRLDQASVRLRASSEAISRIASDVGYESEASFNRAFRRKYGAPPAAWRQNERRP